MPPLPRGIVKFLCLCQGAGCVLGVVACIAVIRRAVNRRDSFSRTSGVPRRTPASALASVPHVELTQSNLRLSSLRTVPFLHRNLLTLKVDH